MAATAFALASPMRRAVPVHARHGRRPPRMARRAGRAVSPATSNGSRDRIGKPCKHALARS